MVCLKVELFVGKDLWYQNDYTDYPRWKRVSFEQSFQEKLGNYLNANRDKGCIYFMFEVPILCISVTGSKMS